MSDFQTWRVTARKPGYSGNRKVSTIPKLKILSRSEDHAVNLAERLLAVWGDDLHVKATPSKGNGDES